jgi:hypothetical protein
VKPNRWIQTNRLKEPTLNPLETYSGWLANPNGFHLFITDEIDRGLVGASVDIWWWLSLVDCWQLIGSVLPGSADHTDIRNAEMDRKQTASELLQDADRLDDSIGSERGEVKSSSQSSWWLRIYNPAPASHLLLASCLHALFFLCFDALIFLLYRD